MSTSMRRMRPMMGTFCIIEVANAGSLNDGINEAFVAMQTVSDLMHPINGTDLSRINNSVAQVIEIDDLTWQVLQLAKHVNECSDGVFDPCLPSHAGCMRDVELLSDNQVICHVPAMIDLGGIAKGFAVDCAVNALIKSGYSCGLVNAGGDVRVFGENQNVYIKMSRGLTSSTAVHPERVQEDCLENGMLRRAQHERKLEIAACRVNRKFAYTQPSIAPSLSKDEGLVKIESGVLQVELFDQALAISQFYHADRPVEHQGYYQRDMEALPLHEHVAVVAQSAAVADALTKCGMFLDKVRFEQLCLHFNAHGVYRKYPAIAEY
ncbi:MAG: FAD:protein FMN transferase [Steroidobacter sp.]